MINPAMLNMILSQVDLDEVKTFITNNDQLIITEIEKEIFKEVELEEGEEQPALLYLKQGGETFGMVVTLPKDFYNKEHSTIQIKRRISLVNIKELIASVNIQGLIDKYLK